MEIPGLGKVTKDDSLGWYIGEQVAVPMLGGHECQIVVEGYDDDPSPEDFHAAIQNFLAGDESVLKEASAHVFDYYQDCNKHWEPDDDEFLVIDAPDDVWDHVRFGTEPMVTRRAYGDKGIYVSLECGCDWEEEHGLQIVLKNGLKVNKVGSFDGHVTNSDAYADDNLKNVVYRRL